MRAKFLADANFDLVILAAARRLNQAWIFRPRQTPVWWVWRTPTYLPLQRGRDASY